MQTKWQTLLTAEGDSLPSPEGRGDGAEPLPKDSGQHRPTLGLTRRRTRPQAGCRSAAGADLVQARSKRRFNGSEGDALHAVLCAAGFNIRWLMRALLRQLSGSGLKHVFLALMALCASPLTGLSASLRALVALPRHPHTGPARSPSFHHRPNGLAMAA